MSELSEIKQQLIAMGALMTATNTNLAVLSANTETINNTIKEIKEEREKHKDTFWERINAQDNAIVKEREDRIKEDNITNTELKVMKTKVTIYTTMIAAGVTLALHWLKGLFNGKVT